jgi:hypothetical protein
MIEYSVNAFTLLLFWGWREHGFHVAGLEFYVFGFDKVVLTISYFRRSGHFEGEIGYL